MTREKTPRFRRLSSYFQFKKGHHYSKEGKDLIDLILSQMNNNRLSTSNQPIIDRDELNLKIQALLNKPSNF